MRLWSLALAVLLLVSCNSILGNKSHYLSAMEGPDAGSATCRLNSDCPTDNVCIYQACGPACNGDVDCVGGARCLKTDTGTACVSSSVATCDAGCPAGTTCSPTDGVCRNACGTAQCLAGQVCSAGLCVGTDQHENGSAGSGSMSEGDAGGAGPVDLCTGVTCEKPPNNSCASASEFQSYDKKGNCINGVCSYVSHQTACTCHNGACAADPCSTVTCASPPVAACTGADGNTQTTYSSNGTCDEGTCSYVSTNKVCPFGCSNGACKLDPCAAVMCASPPAAACKSAAIVTTYAAIGTCSSGTCSYAPTDTACESNKQCGGAGVCSACKTDSSCGATCDACDRATPKCKDFGATSQCVECLSNADCSGATPKCKDFGTTSQCVGCLSNADCSGATPSCNATTNVCAPRVSCVGLPATCGPNGNADCCASSVVTGGTFNRGTFSSANDPTYPATVSDFRLDTYEITVGRFRNFWNGYPANVPTAGSGKNANNPSDPGWDPGWSVNSLPVSRAQLTTNISCGGASSHTWAAGDDALPMNCLDWYEAEAFCIWDGGRLPTEAEWNYAAAGGAQQRAYPWGNAEPDCTYANFWQGGTYFCGTPGIGPLNRVGAESPKGDGLYGQADLAGNVSEWVQDWSSSVVNPCNNCADAASTIYVFARLVLGSGFDTGAGGLVPSYYSGFAPSEHDDYIGARCARSAP